MLFTEPKFFVFFAGVFLVYWALRSNSASKRWLLLASYVFYAAWDWRFLALIAASTALDFYAGRMMAAEDIRERRRRWLVLSLIGNLSTLGFFKYFNLFTTSGVGLLHLLGIPVRELSLPIVLPVGISFYTFQSMSYTIDIYRGDLRPTRSLSDFALFVSFFPQLVAGPIVRAADFLPQLARKPRYVDIDIRTCVALFFVGFVKKVCIADNLAVYVDQVYAAPALYDLSSMWLAVAFFPIQVYCDFSGYSGMALGLAGLLGYRLPPNFNFPLLEPSIMKVCGRWHMSLSTWLRLYVYTPLAGRSRARLITYPSLIASMLLAGLWHGAGWGYVLFGGIIGLGLVAHREWRRRHRPSGSRLGTALAVVGTFSTFALAGVVFRGSGSGDILLMLRALLLLQPSGIEHLATDVGFPLWGLLPPDRRARAGQASKAPMAPGRSPRLGLRRGLRRRDGDSPAVRSDPQDAVRLLPVLIAHGEATLDWRPSPCNIGAHEPVGNCRFRTPYTRSKGLVRARSMP